jgi:hypothetical protein
VDGAGLAGRFGTEVDAVVVPRTEGGERFCHVRAQPDSRVALARDDDVCNESVELARPR